MVSSSKSTIVPEKHPPTERSANFHRLRVHLQVIVWKTMNTAVLDPNIWGLEES